VKEHVRNHKSIALMSVPVRGRADIGRIRDSVTYFFSGQEESREGSYLGRITDPVGFAQGPVRQAGIPGQTGSQRRAR